jgi:hypothetical protein
MAGPIDNSRNSGFPGPLIGFIEGWSVGDAVYFTFVTGLTIGYGDIVPRQARAHLTIAAGSLGLQLSAWVEDHFSLPSASGLSAT